MRLRAAGPLFVTSVLIAFEDLGCDRTPTPIATPLKIAVNVIPAKPKPTAP